LSVVSSPFCSVHVCKGLFHVQSTAPHEVEDVAEATHHLLTHLRRM
jgi:hypothetical protein